MLPYFLPPSENLPWRLGWNEDELRHTAGCHPDPGCQGLQGDCQWRKYGLVWLLSFVNKRPRCIQSPSCDPSALFSCLQYKYKLDHEKQKGHYVGTLTARDDNRIRWALIAGKIQNEREYRLQWAKWKTKFQSPVDMLSVLHSKNSQTLVSDIDYRNYLHQWTCLPDQNDVIQAKRAYELQSDVSGLHWRRSSSLFLPGLPESWCH